MINFLREEPKGSGTLTHQTEHALLGINVVDLDIVLWELSRWENCVGFTGSDHGESVSLGFPSELSADL